MAITLRLGGRHPQPAKAQQSTGQAPVNWLSKEADRVCELFIIQAIIQRLQVMGIFSR